jgi:hypothetical protein
MVNSLQRLHRKRKGKPGKVGGVILWRGIKVEAHSQERKKGSLRSQILFHSRSSRPPLVPPAPSEQVSPKPVVQALKIKPLALCPGGSKPMKLKLTPMNLTMLRPNVEYKMIAK